MISQQKASFPPAEKDFHVVHGSLLSSKSCSYLVQEVLGEGTFGKVAKCIRTDTNKTVAVKITRNKSAKIICQAKEEVSILNSLRALDSDKCNLVRFFGSFTDRGSVCMEFELLDISLIQFMRQRAGRQLPLKEIRPILHQLATALKHLKHKGIVHADVKPENIMMVDHLRQPLRVKLIDLGVAFKVTKATGHPYTQSRWYRSPEIILGLPFSEAIDVWSLGCVAAALFLACHLYPGCSEYDMLMYIVETQGQLPDQVLSCGARTRFFFNRESGGAKDQWKLKTPFQFRAQTGVTSKETRRHKLTSLDDLQQLVVPGDQTEEDKVAEVCDRREFVDLLKRMLQLDASRRVKPKQVLQHPFISMSHFAGGFPHSTHVKACHQMMALCCGPSGSADPWRATLQASGSAGGSAQQKHPGHFQAPQGRPGAQRQPLDRVDPQPSRDDGKRKRGEADAEAGAGGGGETSPAPGTKRPKRGCTEEGQSTLRPPLEGSPPEQQQQHNNCSGASAGNSTAPAGSLVSSPTETCYSTFPSESLCLFPLTNAGASVPGLGTQLRALTHHNLPPC